MPHPWEPLLEHPGFKIVAQELRKFPFVNHISILASLNNIAYQGDASTKNFVKELKEAFNQDLNKMAEIFNHYLKEETDSAAKPRQVTSTETISSETGMKILSLSFPFFIKSLSLHKKG